MIIELTEKEKETLKTLGNRYKHKEKEKLEWHIPDRPVNEVFLSLSNCDDSFSFRGIVNE